MEKTIIRTLITALTLLLFTSQAQAVTLPGGEALSIKVSGFSQQVVYDTTPIFGAGGTGTLGGAGALDAAPLLVPDSRPDLGDYYGVFRIDFISDAATGLTDYYNRFTSSTELTGVFWGATDTSITVGGGGAGTATETQDITRTGLHVAIFEDATPDYDPTLGTAGFTGGPGDPNYNTVTDGTLIWTSSSVPGFDGSDLFNDVFDGFLPQGGGGPGLLSASGGWNANLGAVPFFGTGADNSQLLSPMEFNYTAEATGIADWLTQFRDPIRVTTAVTAVPEPLTATLIPLAVAPLLLRRRREPQGR